MYRIGEFSKMSKTTIKTLRYYDEIGLLKPQETDKFIGYRLYTTDQLFK
ncbi:MAG TPA: MerR family DNA-binding transcriptional regulator, partial [Tissierellia bacterium]|nr:MerR family DNA-binding transcriptional regulator [Tissierellia bacterium]